MDVVSSSCIEPFIMISCSSLYFVIAIALKFTLFDMSIATPDFFLFLFAWNIYFMQISISIPHFQSISVFWRDSLAGSIYTHIYIYRLISLTNHPSCPLIGTSIDLYHDYWQVYTYCHFVTCFDAVFVVLSLSFSFFSWFRLFLYGYPWITMEHHREMLCIQWVCIILWSPDFRQSKSFQIGFKKIWPAIFWKEVVFLSFMLFALQSSWKDKPESWSSPNIRRNIKKPRKMVSHIVSYSLVNKWHSFVGDVCVF